MLLVYILVPLVYAGAYVFVANCLLFFGEYIFYYYGVVHWCSWKNVIVSVAKIC